MFCCEYEMEDIYGWDDVNYAYNLHVCDICGKIVKENVWKDKGTVSIDINNFIIKESNI